MAVTHPPRGKDLTVKHTRSDATSIARRIPLGLLASLLMGGVAASSACTSETSPPDQSGGDSSVSGGRSSSGGSGGRSGSGGADGGGPATGGQANICPEGYPAGGALFVANCATWLDQSEPYTEAGALDVTCGMGGFGGESAGSKPALRQLCEHRDSVDLASVHPVLFCLRQLIEDPCAEDHEVDVLSCLSTPRDCLEPGPHCSCVVKNKNCDEMRAQCPSLDASLCFWSMSMAAYAGIEDEVRSCFDNRPAKESCDKALRRCAWGL